MSRHRTLASRALSLLSRELRAEGCNSQLLPARAVHALPAAAAVPALGGAASRGGFGAAHLPCGAAWFSSSPAPRDEDEQDWEMMNTVIYPESELEVGSAAPQWSAPAVVNGEIVQKLSLADYEGKHVVMLFYPKDFTYTCPTELIAFSERAAEFEALGCHVVAASTDTAEVHLAWIKTPRKRGGLGHMNIPILADVSKTISARYGVLLKDAGIALRGLFIIDDQGVVQHATINSLGVGRSVDEALRTLQAVQFVAEHGEVCPANWKPGEASIKADPDGALEYFEAAAASQEEPAAAGSPLRPVADKAEFELLVGGGGKVAVKFWAPWCGKCKQIAAAVDALAAAHPGVTLASFDTTDERLEALAADLGVKGLPAFRFYHGGKEVAELAVMGYKPQRVADAVAALEKM